MREGVKNEVTEEKEVSTDFTNYRGLRVVVGKQEKY